MGAGSSKAAGGTAAAAAKTVKRRKLPDAASSSASLITRPSPGGRHGASRDDAHAFFRPLRPNDGTLAPVKPAAEVDVEVGADTEVDIAAEHSETEEVELAVQVATYYCIV